MKHILSLAALPLALFFIVPFMAKAENPKNEYTCDGETKNGQKFNLHVILDVFPEGVTDKIEMTVGSATFRSYSKHSLLYRPGKNPNYAQMFDGGALRIEVIDDKHMSFDIAAQEAQRDGDTAPHDPILDHVNAASCSRVGDFYPKPILELSAEDPAHSIEQYFKNSNEPRNVENAVEVLSSLDDGSIPKEAELELKLLAKVKTFSLDPENKRYFILKVIDETLASAINSQDKLRILAPYLEDRANEQVYLQTALDALAMGKFDHSSNELMVKVIAHVRSIKDSLRYESDLNLKKCDMICNALEASLINALNSNELAKLPSRSDYLHLYFEELLTSNNKKMLLDSVELNPDLSDKDRVSAEILSHGGHPAPENE